MSLVIPDYAPPAKWPWLGRIITARRLLALALFLGVLALAAVATLDIECRDPKSYVLTVSGNRILKVDGSGHLLLAKKNRACECLRPGSMDFSDPCNIVLGVAAGVP
jgi:hypothetical protein